MIEELGAGRPMGWRNVVLFVTTAVLAVLCGRLLLPFVPALTWATALAVATRPVYLWLQRKLGGRAGLSSTLMVVAVFVLIVAPVTYLADHVVREVFRVARMVQSGEMQDWVGSMAERHHWAERVLDEFGSLSDGRSGTEMAAGWLAHRSRGFFLSSARMLTELAVMLFSLFFLYRDGDLARAELVKLLPMADEDAERLVGRLSAAIGATLEGRLAIAAVQGTMGGAMFFFLGVPHAAVWGLTMAAAGMIPMLGTLLVWGPVAGYLLLQDHPIKALVMVIWGAGVVGMVDNLLYPTLVGRRLDMHTLTTFFSVLGGVAVFGVSGLVLGPLVMVGAVEMVRLWKPEAPMAGRGRAGG